MSNRLIPSAGSHTDLDDARRQAFHLANRLQNAKRVIADLIAALRSVTDGQDATKSEVPTCPWCRCAAGAEHPETCPLWPALIARQRGEHYLTMDRRL